jgi:glutamyl-tRNA synthetase
VADSGHCPYGNKPPEEIARFAKRIAGDLIARGCEVVVVACNTATAAAIGELRRTWPQIPFVGMEPAIKPAVLGTATGVVAVLATRGTFNGALYRKTAERHSGGVRIVECVPDEFVEMVERGETAGAAAEAAVRKRLEPLLAAGADRIVLGCTHFPHLKPLMEKVAAGRAEIVDSSEAVARRAKQMLDEFRRRAGRQTASSPGYTGRLAPSPTGALHLGNVRTFMIAWLRARQAGGKLILRIEDLDHPKHKPGAAAQAIEDLRWLGFDWDEEFVQSDRRSEYASALAKLRAGSEPYAYPCVCSRKDVEAAQSAPHAGEQLRYPGTCRGKFAGWTEAASAKGAAPCWRFRVPEDSTVAFTDVFAGAYRCDVAKEFGDFPLARDEDGAGYTLAVTVDDAAMGVTEVVRGDDLLAATPQQLLLYRALGLKAPEFFHVPLVVGDDGRRLAKRHGDTRISAFREAGVAPERIIGFLACKSGIAPDAPWSLRDLVGRFDPALMPRQPLRLPAGFAFQEADTPARARK